VTLKNSKKDAVTQKTVKVTKWRLNEIIKIEGFDAGDWPELAINGTAHGGKYDVKFDAVYFPAAEAYLRKF
jgi:hypothetical protein